jgi:very-short-patch-repair endonuclease
MKYADIKSLVRRLRSNLTTEEEILWHNLRKRQLLGRKFVHQTAILYENSKDEYFFYVPDFYCHQERLVVELDGKIHDYQKERDYRRDEILRHHGLKVLRIKNEELYNINDVLDRIKAEFSDQEMRYRKSKTKEI